MGEKGASDAPVDGSRTSCRRTQDLGGHCHSNGPGLRLICREEIALQRTTHNEIHTLNISPSVGWGTFVPGARVGAFGSDLCMLGLGQASHCSTISAPWRGTGTCVR